jgi:predicted  nucleic acid-binding Zn-ribbon protein
MAIAKTEATLQGVNDLKNELSAWDMRLASIKSEIDNLNRKKDSLAKDIEAKKSAHNQEIDNQNLKLRGEMAKFSEKKEEFENQYKAFKSELLGFLKEKNAFETEKTDVLNMKANYEKMIERVGQFVLLVKRASETL